MSNKTQPNSYSKTPNISSPTPAALVLRLGITGHRPNNLQSGSTEMLSAQLRTVFEFLRETVHALHLKAGPTYLKETPVLRLISPLAEGADRLFVNVARILDGDFDLQCVLPF